MAKPTYIFANYGNDWLGIAMRVRDEGYPIRFYISRKPDKGTDETGRDIFDKDEITFDLWKTLSKLNKKEVIILLDDNGQGCMVDHLRQDGYLVYSGSSFADKIEYERSTGQILMDKIGLPTPKNYDFDDIKQGIEFLKKVGKKDTEARFVFKAEGEDFAGSSKTYLGKDIEDLVVYMEWLDNDRLEHHYDLTDFQLQEFIDGYEVDFSAYFDGEKFQKGSLAVDMEEKKCGDGNKGQALGCAGNVVFYLPFNRYFDTYMVKLTPYLKKAGYVGQISINNIFSKKDGLPYGLEFTPRPGWDAQTTEAAIHKTNGRSLAEWYAALLLKDSFDYSHTLVGHGVRVHCQAPGSQREDCINRMFTFDDSIADNLWFYNVSKKTGFWTTEDNTVLVSNTVSKTITGAQKDNYEKVLPQLRLSDAFYRTDIGNRCAEAMQFLKKHNWL